jgi:thymidylate synthase
MVSAWNVGEISEMVLPPCHYGFQVWTRELDLDERRLLVTQEMFNQIYNGGGPETLSHSEIDQWQIPTRAISLMWNQRSVDTPLGLPFNIASYGLLLEIIGKIVNMVPDELIGNLGDTHIYKNQIDGIKEQLIREPFQLPTLEINTEFWPTESGECGIGNLNSNVNFLLENMKIEDFAVKGYQSHPSIKMPLSN